MQELQRAKADYALAKTLTRTGLLCLLDALTTSATAQDEAETSGAG